MRSKRRFLRSEGLEGSGFKVKSSAPAFIKLAFKSFAERPHIMERTPLFLNIWTTQDNTIYNFSVVGCNSLRTRNRRLVTIVGAAIGTMR